MKAQETVEPESAANPGAPGQGGLHTPALLLTDTLEFRSTPLLNFFNAIGIGFKEIWAHKFRSGLTMLQLACQWNLAQPPVSCVAPTLIQEVGPEARPIKDKRAELAALPPEIRLTGDDVAEIRALGDNTGCMALKGASPQYDGAPTCGCHFCYSRTGMAAARGCRAAPGRCCRRRCSGCPR